MKNKTSLLPFVKGQFIKILVLLLCTMQIGSGQNPIEDKTGSPYFQVISGGEDVEYFPLVSTSAEVQIVGPIADVKVSQLYKNEGSQTIEAIYVFPGSTRAAVYDMTMTIGDRVIKADIQEKKQARKTYEQARSSGKRASLLEQHRPNVFQMNVANICPGDEILVELRYNEFIVPEDKIYSFAYPTVVGPRFAGSDAQSSSSPFPSISYTKAKEQPQYDFDIRLSINAGMELKESICPSHKVDIKYTSASTAEVRLVPSEITGGNRDFIFNYSMADGKVSQGTMLYDHGDEKFFLSVLEPPVRVNELHIPPREFVFVMDVSGSMNGFPMEVSKRLMRDLVSKMRPSDKFNVLLFASSSSVLAASSLVANTENLNKAYKFIDNPQGRGGTRLLPALKRALALPVDNGINSRSIVVVTDGYVSVEREAFQLIANNLNKSNLFAFGIGSSVNRHLIEGMAHAGRGEAFVITEQKYAGREADRFRKYIQNPVLTNIEFDFDGIDTYDVIPASIPDLMAERPIYVFGKYRGEAKGQIKVTGHNGQEKFVGTVPISKSLEFKANSPIRYLWAREKIRWLDDLNSLSKTSEDVKALTDLGLKYNLLTKYTSFVAVDDKPAAEGKPSKTVRQAVPMPAGVSNYAVGFQLGVSGSSNAEKGNPLTKVFALVEGNIPYDVKNQLTKIIHDEITFSNKEKSFLNGNVLTLSFEMETYTWVISDERGNLSSEFKEQFTYLMNSIFMPSDNNGLITISMIWI